jgi:CHAT domain-containing protein
MADSLHAESALVELILFDDVRFDAVAPSLAVKSSRYLAFVLRGREPDGVEMIDLGDAKGVERKIAAFHRWLASCSRSKAPARNGIVLRRAVFDPLVRALLGCKRLLIAPDGMFHRLPFEALPDGAGGHVLDTHRISYLVAGRDAGEPSAARRTHRTRAPLVAGAPDFDSLEADEPPMKWSLGDFGPLKGTAIEAAKVAAVLHIKPLLGRRVEKKLLERYRRPRVLHLATHGVFLADPRHGMNTRSLTLAPGRGLSPLGLFHAPPEDPMLRSGLALAGANKARRGLPLRPAAGNGLLLASDVLGLDLAGTELVVLSACETGLGDIRNSEGVYGLCRAFLLAGAQTLVMSLWQVADLATSELMTAYYTALLEQDKAEALTSAKKLIRADAATRHPYFWAAFVSIGNSGPLSAGGTETLHAAP